MGEITNIIKSFDKIIKDEEILMDLEEEMFIDDFVNDNMDLKILSMEGGGVKGISHLKYLKKLEEDTGKRVTELFDVFTGTSVGGLIAVFLNIPKFPKSKIPKYTIDETIDIFIDIIEKCFKKIPCHNILQYFLCWNKSYYDNIKMIEEMEKYFLDLEFNDLINPVIIPIIISKPKNIREIILFSGLFEETQHELLKEISLLDIMIGSVSAPTAFMPRYLNDLNIYLLDGGLWINNPSWTVFTEIKYLYPERKISLLYLDFKMPRNEIGHNKINFLINGGIDIIMEGSDKISSKYLNFELKKDFYHIKIKLNKEIKLDDIRKNTIKYLLEDITEKIENKEHERVLLNLKKT